MRAHKRYKPDDDYLRTDERHPRSVGFSNASFYDSDVICSSRFSVFNEETIQLCEEQERVLKLVMEGRSLCVTGVAGTGKSYLVKEMIARLNKAENSVAVTAPTGLAASLLPNGQTLHSWAAVQPFMEDPDWLEDEKELESLANGLISRLLGSAKWQERARGRWVGTEVLIIDEISMVSKYLFSLLDMFGRKLRGYSAPELLDVPFGGLQIVCVGDFLQLPPIMQSRKKKFCSPRFAFESNVWRKVIDVVVAENYPSTSRKRFSGNANESSQRKAGRDRTRAHGFTQKFWWTSFT